MYSFLDKINGLVSCKQKHVNRARIIVRDPPFRFGDFPTQIRLDQKEIESRVVERIAKCANIMMLHFIIESLQHEKR